MKDNGIPKLIIRSCHVCGVSTETYEGQAPICNRCSKELHEYERKLKMDIEKSKIKEKYRMSWKDE